ncbi:hypothetical protein IIA_02489 [Bacillus cereus VD014]|uniref:Enterochelin esterase N-terminal domain-containing protein n=1 Tax=Bacillus cereus (strain VD014) TaxID=1053223 RepID=A0A9W5NQ56_BACC8|nr:hypothetical protein IIA_02489 [Bacillus cereus VD014]HDR8154810.1 hypothetical protein [Bacillus cereus]
MTTIISPKLEKLKNQLKNGNEKALYTFLHEIKSNHTPLIEQCPADNQYKLITYIWLGDQNTENVYVFGSFPGWDLSVNQLQRLLQTDIWYVTFRTDKSFISTYYFSVNDVFENDWIKRSEQYEIDQFNRNTLDLNATQPHFYIAAGELENKPLLTANRRLYKALKEKEYPDYL